MALPPSARHVPTTSQIRAATVSLDFMVLLSAARSESFRVVAECERSYHEHFHQQERCHHAKPFKRRCNRIRKIGARLRAGSGPPCSRRAAGGGGRQSGGGG